MAKNNSPWIAAFLGYLHDDYNKNIWAGMLNAAKDLEIKLLSYTRIDLSTHRFKDKIQQLKAFIDRSPVQGIIGLSGAIDYDGKADINNLYNEFSRLPIISLGEKIDTAYNILLDNLTGMKAVISHLINHHGLEKIAFLSGPLSLEEYANRFQAYREILAENSLEFDPDLVVECSLSRVQAQKAVDILLDQRKKSIQAIACVNDYMAHFIIEELRSRGIKVPEQIRVSGFDNSKIWMASRPLLTTVHQPLFSMGYQAVVSMVDIIQGRDIPRNQYIKPVFLLRESCGCDMEGSYFDPEIKHDSPEEQLKYCLENSMEFSQPQANAMDYSRSLIQAWQNLIKSKGAKEAKDLQGVIEKIQAETIALYSWSKILSCFFSLFSKYNSTGDLPKEVYMLWSSLVSSLAEKEESRHILQHNKLESQIYSLSHVGGTFYEKFDINANALQVFLKDFNIRHCFICLYCGTEINFYEQASLLTGFNKKRILENTKPQIFDSWQLAPKGQININHGPYVILPIFGHQGDIGFCVVDALEINSSIYEMLTEIISVSIRGRDMIKKITNHTQHLEDIVRENTREIFDHACSVHKITRREKEILELLLQGFYNKEIAAHCSIALRTAEFHIQHIFTKFQATTRLELINKLLDMGIHTTDLID